ncbi:hypothetical protein [Kineosporia sp. R_H_3]|uniref:hypothetical protein n=1 Tax=Kineosporia sp. R_H_3 TaxID=1961848 RepID=UPI000B4AC2F4|nr:hypothetical protein [Kineosporia sp. R_H_3]
MPKRDQPSDREQRCEDAQQVRRDPIGTVAAGGDDPFGLGRVVDHVDAVTNLWTPVEPEVLHTWRHRDLTARQREPQGEPMCAFQRVGGIHHPGPDVHTPWSMSARLSSY